MKHHLSSFRRSPWLSVACLLILGIMFAPLGVMAATSAPATPLASVGGFNPMMLGALGLGAVCIGLRSPASEEGDGGGGGTSADDKIDLAKAVAQIEDKTLPISQRLGVAVQALKGIDPTQQLAGVQKQLTDATATITLKDAEITKLKADLTTAQQTLAAREKDVTELEAANATLETKEKDIDKRASAKANERVAALGFPASKLPAAQTPEQTVNLPENEAALEEALKACATQKERSALLRSYNAARSLAAN